MMVDIQKGGCWGCGMMKITASEASYNGNRWWELAEVKYMGQWRRRKNGGGIYSGYNYSGRVDGMFDEGSSGRYVGIT